jgi:hypothetical protein
MKRIIIVFAALFWLSGCKSTSEVDLLAQNSECGKTCSAHYLTCDGRSSFFPIEHHNNCVDTYQDCVQSCPASSSASTTMPATATSDKASVTDRLKELDSLHKDGAINDSEYSAKKQEILKSL